MGGEGWGALAGLRCCVWLTCIRSTGSSNAATRGAGDALTRRLEAGEKRGKCRTNMEFADRERKIMRGKNAGARRQSMVGDANDI